MIKAKRVILIAENEQIIEKTYWNVVGIYDVLAIVSHELKDKMLGIPIYNFEWLYSQNLDDTLLIIADDNNMLPLARELLARKFLLIRDWVPYWLVETCVIDCIRLYNYVGRDKKI